MRLLLLNFVSFNKVLGFAGVFTNYYRFLSYILKTFIFVKISKISRFIYEIIFQYLRWNRKKNIED